MPLCFIADGTFSVDLLCVHVNQEKPRVRFEDEDNYTWQDLASFALQKTVRPETVHIVI